MRRPIFATLTAVCAVVGALGGSLGVSSVAAARPAATVSTVSTVSTAAIQRVVTLGDSYSSGSGIHRNADDYDDQGPPSHSFDPSTRLGSGACARELDETPGPRLAAQIGAESVFIACAGAVIEEIPNQVTAAHIPADGAGTLVHLTIGGNDIRTARGENWPDALIRCITSSRCDRSDKNQIATFDSIEQQLTDVYTRIGEEYPAITLRALGYPRLMQSDRWCEGVTGVSGAEADWIDSQVDELDNRILAAVDSARAATGADLRFVSVVDAFANHGACRFWQRDRFVNDAVTGKTLSRSQLVDGTVIDHWTDGPLNFSGSSFHPSTKGYDAYLGVLRSSLPPSLLPTR